MAKKADYEVNEGNAFAALGRKNPDELLVRAELLDKVSTLLSTLGCEVKIHVKRPRSRVGIFKHKGCIAVC